MSPANYSLHPRPTFGLGAILAILSAIGGMFLSCGGRPLAGLLLAILALLLGAVGLLQSFLPRWRGGLVSILAIGLGAVGVLVAILVFAFKIILWPL